MRTLLACPACFAALLACTPAGEGRTEYQYVTSGVIVPTTSGEVVDYGFDLDGDANGLVETAKVRITCGGGTYVRSLARDLARSVGSAAHLSALRRVRSGPFDVRDALTLEDLREGRAGLRPALAALNGFDQQPVNDDDIAKVVRGQDIAASVDAPWAALVRADRPDVLVALAEREGERWRPRVVMREA